MVTLAVRMLLLHGAAARTLPLAGTPMHLTCHIFFLFMFFLVFRYSVATYNVNLIKAKLFLHKRTNL